jgi:hypothetical protein
LTEKECSFSVVLVSRENLYGLVLNGVRGNGVTLNGSLGEIQNIEFLEDSVMAITGQKGVIRLDMSKLTLLDMLEKKLD